MSTENLTDKIYHQLVRLYQHDSTYKPIQDYVWGHSNIVNLRDLAYEIACDKHRKFADEIGIKF